MSKRETINVNNLENAFSDYTSRVYSEEELLGFIKNPNQLDEKNKLEQLIILGKIGEMVRASGDFKKKVLEVIEKSWFKPKP